MTETVREAKQPSPDSDSLPDQPEEGTTGAEDTAPTSTGGRVDLEQEGDVAADYLEELLDITDLDGDIDMDVEGERAMVSLVGGNLDHLVGAEGKVLDALQELTRLAVLRETGQRSRLMLDIAGWRAAKRAALTQLGTEAAEKVRASGEQLRLAAMTPFERKIVHDAVAAAGLSSESEGEEPNRRVIVLPA